MFGYVTPMKMEMKIKDYERFKAYYCGLCHEIKKNYGNLSRISLNFDMTFLGLLLDGLSYDKTSVKKIHCPLHITENKAIIIDSSALDYASSINVALFYFKLVDDVMDDKSLKGKIGSLFFQHKEKKFSLSYSIVNKIIVNELENLKKLENSLNFNSIDEISHPFAHLTGMLIKAYPNELINDTLELRDELYILGYNLGKWIYIIDAFDDLKEDILKKKFNPINHLFNNNSLTADEFIPLIKNRIEFTLLNSSASAYESFKNLKINKNYDILDNILSLGLMDKNHKILNKYCQNNCKCEE
ncbi:hypothetical protein SAMN02745163_00880 [Clostridium cavendishii DSM 21758]|uniref:Uncharacterized protein n=1 Tax=Clostridium cavendishii DSM 21758 TaxID=1121302 RepID=A0A1M6ELE3_9CLOT|nr:DUF5685 family protein [Clostridium cavendishii]SHI86226.1 hypothetical protein SAMN02745163_00880 [Clostridium cavendishii DSM 21758]